MRRFISCLSIAGLLACSSLRVNFDYDPEADFSGYSTWGWLVEKQPLTGNPRIDNELIDGRIRTAIGEVLTGRGYTESDTPDFRIGYHLSVEHRLDIVTVDRHYGYSSGWSRSRYGYGPSETYANEWEQGTLLLDVVDVKSDKLVWRGIATDRVEGDRGPEEGARIAREVAAEVLRNFPPPKP